MAREPRTLVKASPGNGFETCRRLKTCYNPEAAINQLASTARFIQPGKVKEILILLSAADMFEEYFRRQKGCSGHPLSQ